MDNKIRLILATLLTLLIFMPGSFFLQVAQAASFETDIGPVAWINVGETINLNDARTLFTTISSETTDEIVGTYSIYINNYATESINLYIGKSGLIAGYYNRYTPESRTILWNSDKLFFSKLASVVTVGQSLGYKVGIENVKYYDYRYPDADRILMATQSLGEQYIGNYDYGSFNINIPNDATVYETSYSIYLNDIYNTQPAATVALDGSIIGSVVESGSIYGVYNGYMTNGIPHIFGIMSNIGARAAAAVIIIYRSNSNTISASSYDYLFDDVMIEPTIPTIRGTNIPTYTVPPSTPVMIPQVVVTMPIPNDTPRETGTASETPKPTQYAPKPPKVSVDLHGERTNIELGQQSLLKGSIVSFNTNRYIMHAQVVIIPPSGVSVVAADFVKSSVGQYTSDFELDPGKGKDIEVTIIPNEVGEFKVMAKITYYFGDNKDDNGYEEVKLDIKAKPRGDKDSPLEGSTTGDIVQTTKPDNIPRETPGFGMISGIGILLTCFFFSIVHMKANMKANMKTNMKIK